MVSDDSLQMTDDAHTPTAVLGARRIRTADLPAFLEQNKPLGAGHEHLGQVDPRRIGRCAGIVGTTSDAFQARLGRKMPELTHGDRSMPVVTVAWNADRFSGRNLALRLVAFGYTNVISYRGGLRGVGGGRLAGNRGDRAGVVRRFQESVRSGLIL